MSEPEEEVEEEEETLIKVFTYNPVELISYWVTRGR